MDDLLIQHPEWAPERPAVGIVPRLSDAELVTLAVIQVLLRFDTEARFRALRPCPFWDPGSPTYPPARPTTNGYAAAPGSSSM